MVTNTKLSQAMRGNTNAAKNHIKKAVDSAKSAYEAAKPKISGAIQSASKKVNTAVASAKSSANKTIADTKTKLVANAARENMIAKNNGEGYKYSLGGYIATKRQQSRLDSQAKSAEADKSSAMARAKAVRGQTDVAKAQASGLKAGAIDSLKKGNFRQAFGQAKSAVSAKADAMKGESAMNKAASDAQNASNRAFKASSAASSYKKQSSAGNYAKNYAKQKIGDLKKAVKKYTPRKVTKAV